MHLLYLAKQYRDRLTPEKKSQFEMKIVAEEIFRNKKKNYPQSIPNWFRSEWLQTSHRAQAMDFVKSQAFGEKMIVSFLLKI
jgi:myosin-1